MQLRTRRGFTQELDEPLDDTPIQILDKQEQQETVSELVTLAQDSLKLHRKLVSALQAVSIVFFFFNSPTPYPAVTFLVLSLFRSEFYFNYAPLTTWTTPILWNLYLVVVPIITTVYSYLRGWLEEEGSLEWAIGGIAMLLLRIVTEWEGQRAVEEAKGLQGLMYESPEA
ncbi:hypothetical protein JCM5353_004502 [Sporobolomyces roseus]